MDNSTETHPNDPDDQIAEFRLNLAFGAGKVTAEVRVPVAPLHMTELLPVLQEFDNTLVGMAEAEVARQGKRISCCAGCGACCRQLVPISEPEARHLAAVVARMNPERRAEIERRFAHVLKELERSGLLDRLPHADQLPDEPSRAELGMTYFALGLPCPFLENESCSIYADRPLACREFLVSSPAENCRHPTAETIDKVPLPVMLSETLYRVSGTGERQPARWFPLVLALQWSADHAGEPEPATPGVELFQKFVRQAARK